MTSHAPVEIEAALSDLAARAFDVADFSYAFLATCGHEEVALKRLRTGNNNASDVVGGVLLRNNIHMAVCDDGAVRAVFAVLYTSAATRKARARFVLTTEQAQGRS